MVTERWAAGRMSHVHDKIKETKKRKASLLGLGDDEEDDDEGGHSAKRASSTGDRPSVRTPVLHALPRMFTTGHSSSAQELWEYVRPYLNIYQNKQIPTRCWIPELLALPRARELKFNPRRKGRIPFVDTDDKKVAALLLHFSGKPALQPCTRCLNGNGAFDGCVKLASNAPVGANIKNCANCW